jgi:hypothetical protein
MKVMTCVQIEERLCHVTHNKCFQVGSLEPKKDWKILSSWLNSIRSLVNN